MKDVKPHDFAILIVRLLAGGVLLYFGSQKALGAFGGQGFAETLASFEQKMGIHPVLAAFAIASEFLGSLGLIFGFATRLAASGVMATMFVAAYQHTSGFDLMKPDMYKDFTYPLMIGGMALALLVSGAGRISIDTYFEKKKSASK